MEYYLRILTLDASHETEVRVLEQIGALTRELRFEDSSVWPIQRYWKIPGWGEMSIRFTSPLQKEQIEARLADSWRDHCADWEWSEIYLDRVCFLSLET